MTSAPRRDDSLADAVSSLADALTPAARTIPVRPPGLLGALAALLTSPPPSTGPCFDKPRGTRS